MGSQLQQEYQVFLDKYEAVQNKYRMSTVFVKM